MATSSGGRIGFEATFGTGASSGRRTSNAPLQILVLANYSGRSTADTPPSLAGRTVKRVDIDNLEAVMGGFGATLTHSSADPADSESVRTLSSLDDFHPDSILNDIPFLADLLAARRGLTQPGKESAAAEKLATLLNTAVPSAESVATESSSVDTEKNAPTESNDATLDRLMGKPPSPSPPTPPTSMLSAVEKLISEAVASSGSVTPEAPSGVGGLLSAVDLELSARVRSILHDPTVQSVEAAWRGLDFLVRRCPDEERVGYAALDATLAEVTGDVEGLNRLLRDAPPDLLVVDHMFGGTITELTALKALATLCSALGVRLLAGAHPGLVGCPGFGSHPDPDDWKEPLSPDVEEAWKGLRTSPAAASVGLALPRVLLRQPYGHGSDPIDSFPFEEIAQAGDHEAFLWGNAAFLCAQVLAETFVAKAEGMDVGAGGEVGELPVFRYKEAGESAMKPCGEAWLVDRAAETLLRRGLIPVLSIKGRDAVRVARFVPLAKLA